MHVLQTTTFRAKAQYPNNLTSTGSFKRCPHILYQCLAPDLFHNLAFAQILILLPLPIPLPTPLPYSLFPLHSSLFPLPHSLFPHTATTTSTAHKPTAHKPKLQQSPQPRIAARRGAGRRAGQATECSCTGPGRLPIIKMIVEHMLGVLICKPKSFPIYKKYLAIRIR